jgi:lectin-like protein
MRPAAVAALCLCACGASVDGQGGTSDAPRTFFDAPAPSIDAPPDARPCAGGDASMTAPDGSCLVFITGQHTFDEATAACAGLSSHLALITSKPLNDAAFALVGNTDVYIGLTDQAVEGTFVWVDGSPLVFANWQPNEPSNGGGSYQEDCAIIAGARMTEQWDDRPCAPVPNVGGGNYAVLCQF